MCAQIDDLKPKIDENLELPTARLKNNINQGYSDLLSTRYFINTRHLGSLLATDLPATKVENSIYDCDHREDLASKKLQKS